MRRKSRQKRPDTRRTYGHVPAECPCVCSCVCRRILRVLCAVLNSRLNCFLLEIYLTQQATTTARKMGRRGAADTHNCSIISHKVKNCCSILGVIQSGLSSLAEQGPHDKRDYCMKMSFDTLPKTHTHTH